MPQLPAHTLSGHHPVVIIGAGQAGLSVSHGLHQRGIPRRVLEKHSPVHTWHSQRWDSFCLVTPNWQCALPGWPYTGDDPHGFMKKDEINTWLDGFVRMVDAPLHSGSTVQRVLPRPGGGFDVQVLAGGVQQHCSADQVVVASCAGRNRQGVVNERVIR